MSCADAYASATEILLIYTFLDLYLIYLNEHDIDARYYGWIVAPDELSGMFTFKSLEQWSNC